MLASAFAASHSNSSPLSNEQLYAQGVCSASVFDQTSAVVIVIIVAVTAIDVLSQIIRRRLL
jgi:ABC-type phosphate/phosphonate transport system permease subunit